MVTIVFVEVPSEPRDVRIVSEPDPTSVNLSWVNPARLGRPLFSVFRVTASADNLNDIVLNYTAINNGISEFVNNVTLSGLTPNTEYTVRVRSVSIHSVLQSLVSSPSAPVQFNTTSTPTSNETG